MTIKNNISASKFLEAVSKCQGDVILSTCEGDVLNLKSTLCQYVFAVISSKKEILSMSEILCKNNQDEKILRDFLEN